MFVVSFIPRDSHTVDGIQSYFLMYSIAFGFTFKMNVLDLNIDKLYFHDSSGTCLFCVVVFFPLVTEFSNAKAVI